MEEQAIKGDWDFKLDPIYYIAILDFYYDIEKEKAKVKRAVNLKEQDCEVFFEKLNYVFLQMPAFNKTEAELETHYDKWLYFLKNLEEIPDILKEPLFEKVFDIAAIANLNVNDYNAYQRSLLFYRDMVNVMRTKYDEGREEGMDLKEIEAVLGMHEEGIPIPQIARALKIAEDKVRQIIETHKK